MYQNLGNKNSDFFEAYLLLSIDSIKKGNFIKSDEYLTKSEKFINNDGFKKVIVSSLKQYLHVFQNKIILKNRTTYGNLTFINETFQRCYLDDEKTDTYFSGLINNDQDYSRFYIFI